MHNYYYGENLSQDIVHGFIAITAPQDDDEPNEKTERDLLDSPWVQRLRQIFQLQTAWFVYPTAEHTRFQHSLGAMHLASRMIEQLYPSLEQETQSDGNLPSRAYVESLTRIAALLHDVGHGPFGHFFDAHFLVDFGLTHEKLGAIIIKERLGDLIRSIRRCPKGRIDRHEQLDPAQVAFLIVRPDHDDSWDVPKWLRLLRSIFCGMYTVDNMDFVLRDAYMTGVGRGGFNLDRLLHYTFFSPNGLTIHQKGLSSLTQFLGVRAELFRSVYFHRTVRAIDLRLGELFDESKPYIFPISGFEFDPEVCETITGSTANNARNDREERSATLEFRDRECSAQTTNHRNYAQLRNPAENLDDYLLFTDRTLMAQVSFWDRSRHEVKRRLGEQWTAFLRRDVPWKLVAETTATFQNQDKEKSSIFSTPALFEMAIRDNLPAEFRGIELRVDIARHLHRPGMNLPTKNLNFIYDPNAECVRNLEEEDMFRHIPQSFKICRVYAKNPEYRKPVSEALSLLISTSGSDDLTNM